ncbi:hypothetical protein [Cohnella sp.]
MRVALEAAEAEAAAEVEVAAVVEEEEEEEAVKNHKPPDYPAGKIKTQ